MKNDKYEAEPADIQEPVVLIKINQLYQQGMSGDELYEVTRGVWKMSERRNKAHYAFAVFHGVVLEVYKIQSWHVGGTTEYNTRPFDDINVPERWEFVGKVAEDSVRRKYIGKSITIYTAINPRLPITYVNC